MTIPNALAATVAEQSRPPVLPNEPRALVDSLYRQVVARHPLGIPYGADMKVFRPFLSKGLLHKFTLSDACFNDYLRQRKDSSEKPPGIGLFENGIFSGGANRSEPRNYQIEKVEKEKDASSRVYVKLTWEDPSYPDVDVWYVALVVVRENGRQVVNDVLYLKDQNGDVDWTLSNGISPGCTGANWVG